MLSLKSYLAVTIGFLPWAKNHFFDDLISIRILHHKYTKWLNYTEGTQRMIVFAGNTLLFVAKMMRHTN